MTTTTTPERRRTARAGTTERKKKGKETEAETDEAGRPGAHIALAAADAEEKLSAITIK